MLPYLACHTAGRVLKRMMSGDLEDVPSPTDVRKNDRQGREDSVTLSASGNDANGAGNPDDEDLDDPVEISLPEDPPELPPMQSGDLADLLEEARAAAAADDGDDGDAAADQQEASYAEDAEEVTGENAYPPVSGDLGPGADSADNVRPPMGRRMSLEEKQQLVDLGVIGLSAEPSVVEPPETVPEEDPEHLSQHGDAADGDGDVGAAALTLQSAWRGRAVRKALAEVKQELGQSAPPPAVAISAATPAPLAAAAAGGVAAQPPVSVMDLAARKIQSIVRMMMVRHRWRLLRDHAHKLGVSPKQDQQAILTVQRLIRGYLARRKWRGLKKGIASRSLHHAVYSQAQQERAALNVQRLVRGFLARRKWRILRSQIQSHALHQAIYSEQQREQAALNVQRLVRGFLARRKWRQLRQQIQNRSLHQVIYSEQQREQAARNVQRLVRGFLARRKWRKIRAQMQDRSFHRMVSEADAARAAIAVQKVVRGFLTRRKWRDLRRRIKDRSLHRVVADEKQLEQAVVTAQRVIRGFLVRKRWGFLTKFGLEKGAQLRAVKLQRAQLDQSQPQEAQDEAARKIQRAYRRSSGKLRSKDGAQLAWNQRVQNVQVSGSTADAAATAGRQQRDPDAAARTIQRGYRSFVHRRGQAARSNPLLLQAATKIQAAARGMLARKHFRGMVQSKQDRAGHSGKHSAPYDVAAEEVENTDLSARSYTRMQKRHTTATGQMMHERVRMLGRQGREEARKHRGGRGHRPAGAGAGTGGHNGSGDGMVDEDGLELDPAAVDDGPLVEVPNAEAGFDSDMQAYFQQLKAKIMQSPNPPEVSVVETTIVATGALLQLMPLCVLISH